MGSIAAGLDLEIGDLGSRAERDGRGTSAVAAGAGESTGGAEGEGGVGGAGRDIASSHGRASEVPRPRSTVRRDNCLPIIIIIPVEDYSSVTIAGGPVRLTKGSLVAIAITKSEKR